MTGEVLLEHRDGGRILRAGDEVKITRLRGLFTIRSFRVPDVGPVEVTVYGGPAGGVRMFRTVTLDRVGVRKRLAGAAT